MPKTKRKSRKSEACVKVKKCLFQLCSLPRESTYIRKVKEIFHFFGLQNQNITKETFGEISSKGQQCAPRLLQNRLIDILWSFRTIATQCRLRMSSRPAVTRLTCVNDARSSWMLCSQFIGIRRCLVLHSWQGPAKVKEAAAGGETRGRVVL